MTTRRRWMALCAAVVALSLGVISAQARTAPAAPTAQADTVPSGSQRTAPPLHVNVRLVNVFVNVTNVQGAPVTGLTQQDFALTEDGRPEKIAYFERETNVPLSVVMAIDTSGSTRINLRLEQTAARDFALSILGQPPRRRWGRSVSAPASAGSRDQMALMDFNSSVRQVVPFTGNARQIEWGLRNLDYGPATAFYNAVVTASRTLAAQQGRRVLVVISDGGNTVGSDDFPDALEAARRGAVMIYSIIDMPILANAGRDLGGEHAMISLSRETGGEYFYANQGDLTAAFEKVAAALRTQYLLSYYPDSGANPDPTHFRRIRVTLTHAAASDEPYTVANRAGYYPDANR